MKINGKTIKAPVCVIRSPAFGTIKLSHLSLGDINELKKLYKKEHNGRNFILTFLSKKLKNERAYVVKKLTDGQLKYISLKFLKANKLSVDKLKLLHGYEYFTQVREIIYLYCEDYTKKINKQFSHFSSTKEVVKKFQESVLKSTTLSLKMNEQIKEMALLQNPLVSARKLIIDFPLRINKMDYFISQVKENINAWNKWKETQTQYFRNWTIYWEQAEKKNAKAIKAIKKYKWLLPPSMSYCVLDQISKALEKSDNIKSSIDKIFVEYFMSFDFKELRIMTQAWGKVNLFKKRIKILNDCVNVLSAGYNRRVFNPCNVIIPTLIAQIDGISQDMMKSNGLNCKGFIWYNSLGEKVKRNNFIKDLSGTLDLYAGAEELFVNYLFQTAIPRKPLGNPFSFSRHKIMHGENCKYGRIDIALRAFLTLDFLSYLDKS